MAGEETRGLHLRLAGLFGQTAHHPRTFWEISHLIIAVPISASYLALAMTAMSRLLQSALLGSLLVWVQAATVTYDFEIGWVRSNPDGVFDRPTIGINGQWPIPAITADVGDRIIVNVLNSLGNQTTSLHFHGLYQ